MTVRPSTCRYCGRPIAKAATGRPRWFCGDVHRKLYAKATRDQLQVFLAGVDAAAAVRELAGLRHDLVSLLGTCSSLAHQLELTGDVVAQARVAAVGEELGRTLARHFGSEETKP